MVCMCFMFVLISLFVYGVVIFVEVCGVVCVVEC